jgi:hypothetical protein
VEIDEASVALKLEAADEEGWAMLEAAVAAAGLRIASTCIGIPRD